MAAVKSNTRDGAAVIPFPTLAVEMKLSEIESMLDAMIYMHEVVDDDARERIMRTETGMLWVMKDIAAAAHRELEKLTPRRHA
jgi:hypothetical protein